MNWDYTRAAFLDELEKIAEVSLAGLSPAAALSSQAPPMETAGFQKARDVLGRAESMKTAAGSGAHYYWPKGKSTDHPKFKEMEETATKGVDVPHSKSAPTHSDWVDKHWDAYKPVNGKLVKVSFAPSQDGMKTAAAYSPATMPGMQAAASSKTEDQKAHPSAISQTKSLGAHVLGTAGASGYAMNLAHGKGAGLLEGAAKAKLHSRNWHAAVAGGALGAAEYGRQRLKRARLEQQQQKTAMISPAMQLRASKQVARVGNSSRATSSIAEHVRGSQIH